MVYLSRLPVRLETLDDLREFILDEFRRIAIEMQKVQIVDFEMMHREPDKIHDGMVIYADGTDLNPGSGAGLYERRGGAWVKL